MAWRVICDRCARKRWNHELRLEWTGLRVCADTCFEKRHPQEFVRGVRDKQTVPWARPEPDDTFVLEYLRREDGGIIFRENGIPYIRE